MYLQKVNTLMYTRQLRTFMTTAEKGSFNSAAEYLDVTPASVMKQVNSLEERVGTRLFTRTNQGVQLTAAGEIIYKAAGRLTEEADAAVAEARKAAGTVLSSIRIGTSLLNPCRPLIDLYNSREEMKSLFSLRIIPYEDDSRKILSLLSVLGKEIDVVVGSCGSERWRKQCSLYQLGSYKVCIAVPQRHLLASRSSLTIEDLHGETLMMGRAGDTEELDRLRAELQTEHPEIRITDTQEYYDAKVFNEAVEKNCLLLTLDAWKDVHPSLITIPVDWDYSIPYGIIYARKPSRAVEEFIERLR